MGNTVLVTAGGVALLANPKVEDTLAHDTDNIKVCSPSDEPLARASEIFDSSTDPVDVAAPVAKLNTPLMSSLLTLKKSCENNSPAALTVVGKMMEPTEKSSGPKVFTTRTTLNTNVIASEVTSVHRRSELAIDD